jgi:spermidine/putrescine transport system substrate-binding protein
MVDLSKLACLKRSIRVLAIVGFSLFNLACVSQSSPAISPPTTTAVVKELIFYDWAEDSITDVFEAFSQEYGVKVTYLTYESQEEAIENIRAGQKYDVVIMENQFIPILIQEGLLAEIEYRNVPNFKNISANFRDLAYDPNNKYTIPYSWGTTGLVVRSDLIEKPITRWADLWHPRYTGRVAMWSSTPRYTLGASLKSLGFSVNSEKPTELEEALRRLRQLQPRAIWLDDDHSSAPLLISGEAVLALGWAEDVWLAQAEREAITYVLPEEGTIMWGDNFIIPANSPNKYAAELFLNFILQPEISAQIINGNYYPMPNDAAKPFIKPEILADPVVYPPNEALKNAELLLPLTPAGERLHASIWERFLATNN